jgi:putative membrane protein insertion efficiency factor
MKKILLNIIAVYKEIVSPTLVVLFGHGCKFSPTCSQYAQGSIKKYGTMKGIKLSLLRFSKCHPLNRSSYFDPVPEG